MVPDEEEPRDTKRAAYSRAPPLLSISIAPDHHMAAAMNFFRRCVKERVRVSPEGVPQVGHSARAGVAGSPMTAGRCRARSRIQHGVSIRHGSRPIALAEDSLPTPAEASQALGVDIGVAQRTPPKPPNYIVFTRTEGRLCSHRGGVLHLIIKARKNLAGGHLYVARDYLHNLSFRVDNVDQASMLGD